MVAALGAMLAGASTNAATGAGLTTETGAVTDAATGAVAVDGLTAATGAELADAALAPGIISFWPVLIRSGFLMSLACMRVAIDVP